MATDAEGAEERLFNDMQILLSRGGTHRAQRFQDFMMEEIKRGDGPSFNMSPQASIDQPRGTDADEQPAPSGQQKPEEKQKQEERQKPKPRYRLFWGKLKQNPIHPALLSLLTSFHFL